MAKDLMTYLDKSKKFYQEDFSGKSFVHADFRFMSFIECNFSKCDLRYSNFTGSNCYGSNFTDSRLTRANMMECCLEKTIFKPRDVFGLTITLKCDTFAGMDVDETWLKAWLFFPAIMKLPLPKNGDLSWEGKLIEFLGETTYRRYKAAFSSRIV